MLTTVYSYGKVSRGPQAKVIRSLAASDGVKAGTVKVQWFRLIASSPGDRDHFSGFAPESVPKTLGVSQLYLVRQPL